MRDEDLDELERRFTAAWNSPKARRAADRATRRLNLSRKARARLWWERRVNAVAIWLACHGQPGARLDGYRRPS